MKTNTDRPSSPVVRPLASVSCADAGPLRTARHYLVMIANQGTQISNQVQALTRMDPPYQRSSPGSSSI